MIEQSLLGTIGHGAQGRAHRGASSREGERLQERQLGGRDSLLRQVDQDRHELARPGALERELEILVDGGLGAGHPGSQIECGQSRQNREQESDVKSMIARAETTCAVNEHSLSSRPSVQASAAKRVQKG